MLKALQRGFTFKSQFEYPHPPPWGHVENYPPLLSVPGRQKLREAMKKQVLQGKMIGGPGWSKHHISLFFGEDNWYGIPCGAVTKDGDPLGRIVHDYGYYKQGSYSINAAHSDTSVKYDSIRKRVRLLENVIWYIKADLESGFREFGTHPADWRFQVYCNGPNEHYVDLACPFGKTNSTLEFCPPVKLFAISAARRWSDLYGGCALP